jgi:hypothetical protein
MPSYSEEQLADLVGLLPPAPAAWVQAAQQLPAAREAIDSLVETAQADAAERRAILADLEASLRRAGVEPRRALVEELRGRLEETS